MKRTGIPYYPGAVKIPAWVGEKTHTVDSVPALRGGRPCVRLREITTWCAVENLEKANE